MTVARRTEGNGHVKEKLKRKKPKIGGCCDPVRDRSTEEIRVRYYRIDVAGPSIAMERRRPRMRCDTTWRNLTGVGGSGWRQEGVWSTCPSGRPVEPGGRVVGQSGRVVRAPALGGAAWRAPGADMDGLAWLQSSLGAFTAQG